MSRGHTTARAGAERARVGLLILACLAVSGAAWAEGVTSQGEWPGFWGPERSASVPETLKIGPTTKLKEVWRRPLGKGYAEIAVVGDRGYTVASNEQPSKEQIDHIIAFDFGTGKDIWRTSIGPSHPGLMGSDDGLLSSPLVHNDRVFVLDPFGNLLAFDAGTGEQLWKIDLPAAFNGKAPNYGYASSPLAVGNHLIVQVGSAEQTLVALDPATGATVWTSSPAEQNSYASPLLTTLASTPQIVSITTDRIFGLEPSTGSVLWTQPVTGGPLKGPTMLPDNRIAFSSWAETTLLKISQKDGIFEVEEQWKTPTLKASYTPVLYHAGHLFGMDRTYLSCLDAKTGEVVWKQKIYESNLILVGKHLAVLGQKSGIFHLIEAAPSGFQKVLETTVFTPGARTVTGPTYVDGHFLLRNGEEMVQLELVDEEP